MAERTYKTVMRNQDRFLAEMAANAGGCLALVAHNIHVVEPEAGRQTILQRDNYSTRRKNRIEHASFNVRKDFKVVKKPKKKFNSISSEEDTVVRKKNKSKGKMKNKRKSIENFEKTNKTKSESKGDETKECNLQIKAGPAIDAQISEGKELSSKLEVTKMKESKNTEWKAKTVDLNLDFLDDLVRQSSSLGESKASRECSGKKAEKESVLEVKVKQEPSECREALDLFNAGAGIFMATEGIADINSSFDLDAFD